MELPQAGILILNYHQPEATLACVKSFLERGDPQGLILWIENDAHLAGDRAQSALQSSGLPWIELASEGLQLPKPGEIGLLRVSENRGYAGGNNVGLRRLFSAGIPYAWVLNNDTLLVRGSVGDLISKAEANPEVGLWGTHIRADHCPCYFGGLLNLNSFSIDFATTEDDLQQTSRCFISGCSMFFRTAQGAALGWIPEDYFLYYEDPAFSLEFLRRGLKLGFNPEVEIFHTESLSTGRRSWLMEFYNRRNRWHFIQRYFPEYLDRQLRRRWYIYQKLLLRGKWRRIQLERMALQDFRDGRTGPTQRDFSRHKFI